MKVEYRFLELNCMLTQETFSLLMTNGEVLFSSILRASGDFERLSDFVCKIACSPRYLAENHETSSAVGQPNPLLKNIIGLICYASQSK